MMSSPGIQIQRGPQPDPNLCRLVADRSILPGDSVVCADRGQAQSSPLLKSLFEIPGITQVWIRDETVTLQKFGGAGWSDSARQAGVILREFLSSGARFEFSPA